MPWDTVGMAQPHKGDRVLIASRPLRDVYDGVQQRAAARGVSISQYTADVLANHIGREDLVRDLDKREGLPLAI